jgi:ribonuclease E
VKQYADPVPLFQRYGAEDQLSAMYDPVVQLKSGGYLVINPTEALVSIDINSGRSTKEHGIEATALSTNLEAAREISRQLAPARHGWPRGHRLHRHGVRIERP